MVGDVPWDDYYGPGSPLQRLVEWGGRVLRLGADIDTVTLIHYAEYVTAVANKRRVRRYRKVHGESGPVVRVVECLDDSNGIVDYPGPDYFGIILSDYLAAGRGKQGMVGGASSELVDAADLVEFAAAWMARHFESQPDLRA
jgi:aminoglycoside N3'-acetyltransferase